MALPGRCADAAQALRRGAQGLALFGGVGGYQNAVVRVGEAIATWKTPPVTHTPALHARNVVVEECDLAGTWVVVQGKAQHAVFRNNRSVQP